MSTEAEAEPLKGKESQNAETKPLQADGLPDMSDVTPQEQSALMTVLASPLMPIPVSKMLAPFAIFSIVVALLIFSLGATEVYSTKIAALGEDAGWMFLGAFVFSRMVLQLNFYPMAFKQKIMRRKSGNLRCNMAIFKALDSEGAPSGAAIVMDTNGAVGQYNRANRSLAHFSETVPAVIFTLSLVSRVFAFPAFVLTIVFAAGRIAHQRGEAAKYGSHGGGFMLTMIATLILEGLCLVGSLKAFGLSITLGEWTLL